MTPKKHISLILFLALSYLHINAQFARFRHLTTEDGLPENLISCVAQDKNGFIWFGTQDGLCQYDGIKLKVNRGTVEDSLSLYSNTIRCLYIDSDYVWAGTLGGGLSKLNLRTGKITNYLVDIVKKNKISHNNVNSIIEFEPGKLLIGTSDGLNIFDKQTENFTIIKTGDKSFPILSNIVRCITKDKRGHIWMAHPSAGVTEYDPIKKTSIFYEGQGPNQKLNSTNVRYVFADSKGLIWVSCWNAGCNIINTKTGKIYSRFDSTDNVFKQITRAGLVSQFIEDKKGNIWYATAENGIGRFDAWANTSTYFSHDPNDPETISDNTVFSIFEDKSGLIWAGTWKSGINIFNPKNQNMGYYKHESTNPYSLPDNKVYSFCQKNANEILVGTALGVNVFDLNKKKFTPLPIDEKDVNSLRHNSIIYSMLIDSDSSLWVGSAGGGLYRYFPKKNKYRNYIPNNDSTCISHHTISDIVKDKKNRLWISTTGGGLNQYNYESDNFTSYFSEAKNESTLSSNTTYCMLLSDNGKIWVGTDNGLNLFDPETKKCERFLLNENGKTIFPSTSISSLFIDKNRVLWVGTSGGLCSFDPVTKKATNFYKLDNVFTHVVLGITQAEDGDIWISTDVGLIRFNYSAKTFKTYTTNNGLQGRNFSLNAVDKLANGKLIFGGLNGLNIFNPKNVQLNTSAPTVKFIELTVLNVERKLETNISYLEELILSYKDYFFSVDFAALDFTSPLENNYEYKLEGFNDDWVEVGNKPTVTFTNLDPGEYTLLVRAENNDGVLSVEPAKIKITITPPFWRTTWFYILCLVMAGLLIYNFIKRRERKLIKEKEVLEKKVEERTAELTIEKLKVEEAHKDIKDSINYAKRIQEAQMPTEKYIEKKLKDLKK